MCRVIELSLGDLAGNSVFWSKGNAPTQRSEGLSAREVRLHFIAAYLLSDTLLASASFYYESVSTRVVTQDFAEIFLRGDAYYFVDESMDNFQAHARKKAEKSPSSLRCYHDSEGILRASKELDALGHILRRPDDSVSAHIADLWSADLDSGQADSLGANLMKCVRDQRSLVTTRERLKSLSVSRGGNDFVWQFIEPTLKSLRLPPSFLRHAKRRLAQFYSVATGCVLGLPIDNALHVGSTGLGPQSRYDTTLFLECMDALHLEDERAALDTSAVIKIKSSPEFLIFRDFYFSLIDAARYNPAQLLQLLPLYSRLEERLSSGVPNRETIILAFTSWCRDLPGDTQKYTFALSRILQAYDAFGTRVIRDIFAIVSGLSARTTVSGNIGESIHVANLETQETSGQNVPSITNNGIVVFMNGGHMGDEYRNEGIVGAMGPNASAHDNVLLQEARNTLSGVTLRTEEIAMLVRIAEALSAQNVTGLVLRERLEGAQHLVALADAAKAGQTAVVPLARWKCWAANLGERSVPALAALANLTTIASPIAKLLGLPL